jgi:hypothetical protein
MEYVDPIPPIIRFMKPYLPYRIYGNRFASNPELPSLLVRSMGGTDYYRIQLVCRSDSDISAMSGLIQAMNLLERDAQYIQGLRVLWAERESNPIHDIDSDTGKPEAWCYIRLEAMES